MTSIAVVVGNPQPSSRTRLVAEEVAAQLAARSGATVLPTVDLADVAGRLFVFPEPAVDAIRDEVADADVLVVASPTYKGAYTGLLKAFLDRYGSGGLQRVAAVPILTIGSPAHALAVEHTLRPLLVELGASVPTRGIAFPAAEVDDRFRLVGEWLEGEWPRIAPALTA
ncbi:NADPH-dependent FMN reductase [Microbacterium marinilacus]|uniref:NAD(P)H-dependent oxidoreductase n=1 Tax=Microbacterium marinilacus TaxID=415209 RepID=A0ABP7BRB3_9MICO|nr:NAD(P)H-dependent oxidoreductase [Microbacterium marinilacus]MBY0689195.1 NAD(P)H-dependent oxidoreductase [Microbacterium marinilacus]